MKSLHLISAVVAGLALKTGYAVHSQLPSPPAHSEQTVEVTADHPSFQLDLIANATTGYKWFVANYPESLIVPISHQYVAPASEVVGAPGVDYWQFKVLNKSFTVPRRFSVKMTYARSFTDQPATERVIWVYTRPSISQ